MANTERCEKNTERVNALHDDGGVHAVARTEGWLRNEKAHRRTKGNRMALEMGWIEGSQDKQESVAHDTF